jgi:hypothetical protein
MQNKPRYSNDSTLVLVTIPLRGADAITVLRSVQLVEERAKSSAALY